MPKHYCSAIANAGAFAPLVQIAPCTPEGGGLNSTQI